MAAITLEEIEQILIKENTEYIFDTKKYGCRVIIDKYGNIYS